MPHNVLGPLPNLGSFLWSEFIPSPGTSSDTSEHFHKGLLGVVRVHPTSWDQLGPLQNFYRLLLGCGPSSSHLPGPARTPPAFLQIFTPSLDPSQVFTNFYSGWSEFIPPPGTSSDPSQTVTNLHFGWSEFIPPPGTSSDPPKLLHIFISAA